MKRLTDPTALTNPTALAALAERDAPVEPATPAEPATLTAPETPTAPDAVDTLADWRLRPGVAFTPLRNGLHLRGRRATVTLEGSAALPGLWRLLEQPLRTGDTSPLTSQAPPGSPLRRALTQLITHLHTHDLLVPSTTAPPWLRALADAPDAAATALAHATPTVLAADPAHPLARAAAQALTRSGTTPAPSGPAPQLAPGRVLLLADSAHPVAVALATTPTGGYVTHPGSPAQALADAAALHPDQPDHTASPLLADLLAGAAAHRLLCALAGLPDPAAEGEDARLLPGLPAVLIAELEPPQAMYHPWLGPDRLDPDRRTELAPPPDLATALHRASALTDPRTGLLAAPRPGRLPQLPLAQVETTAAGRLLRLGGLRLDLARLDATCHAAELELSSPEARFTVGADPTHARGLALRRATLGLPRHGLPTTAWGEDPQACHWWRTAVTQLGPSTRLRVERLADGVHRATVLDGRTPIGRAVEATPADAVTFATLNALSPVPAPLIPSGATAPLVTAGQQPADWEDTGWTTGWLAQVAARERALQAALHALTDPIPGPVPPGPLTTALTTALRTVGYTVLPTPGGHP
ncbi:hypothetical protein CFP65_6425 [Kitasatospora sp. MMS16-BH015]|uniref:hypothetical protein n=1 Tax=Kitasatospora sp. MMS16-BH015 TaxID=2018025 RepID=UPI000CA09461|nr:hypothetical protein [Kitasatospora sp. MMS16-BH015]AUG81081.1 hypothetical protein CFP65_6425 [Kitasatospora sp. MMS16-BH015]